MKKAILQDVLKLRLSIGYLGEAGQHGWWPSSFFSSTSVAFLSPVFSRTSLTAQYYGVRKAATLVHDEHIGIGKGVFHLFRLPETHEIEMHRLLNSPDMKTAAQELTKNKESAGNFLSEYGKGDDRQAVGPVKIGDAGAISESGSWAAVAGLYADAFINGNKTFPYFTSSK
jgi:hypothetical protein